LIAGQTCVLIAAGLGAGIVASVMLTRKVQALLFGVEALDAVTMVSAAGLLLIVTSLAASLPARRATRIDPMTALH
jgi:ABC-type antimicrobial peptide transport system permease subunit